LTGRTSIPRCWSTPRTWSNSGAPTRSSRRRRFLTGIEASQLEWFTPAGTPMAARVPVRPGRGRTQAGDSITVGPRSIVVLRSPLG